MNIGILLTTGARGLLVFLIIFAGTKSPYAQEVNWDRQVRAGNTVIMQSVYEPTQYYWAGTRARLARENGLPKFSFVRFVRTNEEGEESIGGGIVHALVELGVTDRDIEDARAALANFDSSGELVGPIAFTEGTFTLHSIANSDEEEGITRSIVGMGKAPLLAGDRAAVSILLTQDGAQALWASMNSATPDLTFSFDMKIDAYRSPIVARVRANFDKIYEHENFAAAIRAGIDSQSAQVMLGAEIDMTFDELHESGIIDVVQIGSDESMDRVLEAVYEDLRERMFQPANVAGDHNFTPEMRDSAYDRASAMFDQAEANREQRNQEMRDRQGRYEEAQARCAGGSAQGRGSDERQARLDKAADNAEMAYERSKAEFDTQRGRIETQIERLGSSEENSERVAALQSNIGELRTEVERLRSVAENARSRAEGVVDSDNQSVGDTAQTCEQADLLADAADWQQGTQLTVSAYAAYRIKKVRQTGTYELNNTKYKAASFPLRFDANIGDVSRYLDNDRVFLVVPNNPLIFEQKNIYVDVSGVGSSEFGEDITSASVVLTKKHGSGEVSRDSLSISRNNFLSNENRLSYIPRGDSDVTAFDEYEYKVTWNYAGGSPIVIDGIKSNEPSIPLSPPLEKSSLKFELDPVYADEMGVRAVSIRTFGVYGDARISGPRVALSPDGGLSGYSGTAHVLADPNTGLIEYEATYTYSSGEEKKSGRRSTSSSLVILNGR